MPDPHLLESGKYIRPILLWTWLTTTSTHSGLGVLGLANGHDPYLFKSSNMPHPCYLGLANMLDPPYFGLC
jgi:hypothetical protein